MNTDDTVLDIVYYQRLSFLSYVWIEMTASGVLSGILGGAVSGVHVLLFLSIISFDVRRKTRLSFCIFAYHLEPNDRR